MFLFTRTYQKNYKRNEGTNQKTCSVEEACDLLRTILWEREETVRTRFTVDEVSSSGSQTMELVPAVVHKLPVVTHGRISEESSRINLPLA